MPCSDTPDAYKVHNIFNVTHASYITSSTIQKRTYTVVITTDKEDGRFVGWCDDLHATSYGDTFGEIVANMVRGQVVPRMMCNTIKIP